MNTLIWCIIAIAVLVGIAYVAKWLIESFIKAEPLRTVLMVASGVVLLILLLIGSAQIIGGGSVHLGQNPFSK